MMSADPLQLVLVLDVRADVKEADLRPLLLPQRARYQFMYLSKDGGGPTPGAKDAAKDWPRLARAVEQLVRKALAEKSADQPVELYVAGLAPLPLFAHLGQAISKFIDTQFVLNRDQAGTWTRYALSAGHSSDVEPFFDVIRGLERPAAASGRVALFISTIGAPSQEEAMARFLENHGEALAGIVEVRTADPGPITAANATQVALELVRTLSRVPGHFPRASGLALFVAGPAQLAFMAGRAINPHLIRGDVWVGEYAAPDYELAMKLPFQDLSVRLDQEDQDDSAAKLARREVLDAITNGIEALQRHLDEGDLPASLSPEHKSRLLMRVASIKRPQQGGGDEFRLRILKGELSLGRGLLEALRGEGKEVQEGIGQLLFLHEIYHDEDQELRSSNYHEVGRAGIVLEELDFRADAFSLETLIRWDVRQGGERARREVGVHAARWMEWALRGMAAFDRLEYGDRIDRLAERRLRRYLLWSLQRERATVISKLEQLGGLFQERPIIELAPLSGHLDERFDKIVIGPLHETELFLCLHGRLLRKRRVPGFDPGALVEKVRRFDLDGLFRALEVLIDNHREMLLPWEQ